MTQERHEIGFLCTAHQEKVEALYDAVWTLAWSYLDDPLSVEESDRDHDIASDIMVGLLDRLKHRLTEGEWPEGEYTS